MQQKKLHTIKCVYCDIMLEGREQFMGHMIHSHELDYYQLERLWTTMTLSGEYLTIKKGLSSLEEEHARR